MKRKILTCICLSLSILTMLVGCGKNESKEETTEAQTETLASEEKTYEEIATVKSFNDELMFTGSYSQVYDISTGIYMDCEGEKVYSIPADSGIQLAIGQKLKYTYSYMTNTDDSKITLVSVEVVTDEAQPEGTE